MERCEACFKCLTLEAVVVLPMAWHSSDEKTAIASAVHILKTVGPVMEK
jgi:hypothetical protein